MHFMSSFKRKYFFLLKMAVLTFLTPLNLKKNWREKKNSYNTHVYTHTKSTTITVCNFHCLESLWWHKET